MGAIINDDRYMIYEQLQPLADGILYSGRDISLQRDVFLFVIQKEKANLESFMQTLSKVSGFSNSRFFHILNAGETAESFYAVLTAWTGTALSMALEKHTLSPQEIISEVLALGTSIMDALEAGITEVNVTAENLWLTQDKKMYILDIWTKSYGEHTHVKGLCRLIYQLGVYSSSVPADWEQKPDVPLPAFSEWNETSAQALMNLAWLGFHGEHTLSSFMLELHTILEQSGVVVPSISHKVVRAKQKIAENTMYEATSTEEDPFATVEYERRTDESETEESTSPSKTLNRLTVVFTCVVVAILAVAMVWSNVLDREGENQSVADEVSDHNEIPDVERGDLQIGQKDANEQPVDSQDDTAAADDETNQNDEGGSQASGDVGSFVNPGNIEDQGSDERGSEAGRTDQDELFDTPSLLGMTLKEAEQHAYDSGLHWEYFIINSDKEQGKVFMQQPEPGEPIEKGDRVTFWVSR